VTGLQSVWRDHPLFGGLGKQAMLAEGLRLACCELDQEHGEPLPLRDFVPRVFETVDPGSRYLPNWHVDLMAEYLEAAAAGDLRRLVINVPPRYLKSITVSVAWPAWLLGRDPSAQIMAASYSADLALQHSVDCRLVVTSDWYRHRFPRVLLARDQNEKSRFQTTARGHRIATSVGGSATGSGGNVLIVDDPLNPKQAASDAQREHANTWFDQTFSTRLNDKKSGVIVVVMQRLHERDLTGHLLEQGGWEHLKLPGVARERAIICFREPLPPERSAGLIAAAEDAVPEPLPPHVQEADTAHVYVREEGDILHPDREGPEEIADAKRRLGSYGYAGQYDQDPSPAEGGIIKRWWWRWWQPRGAKLPPVRVRKADGTWQEWEPVELPADLVGHLQSWDMAFKDTKDSAYVVGQVWAKKGADRFFLDQDREKRDFPRTLEAVEALSRKWGQTKLKLVEDKANGPAVIATLKHKIAGLVAEPVHGDKQGRLIAASPAVEAGNVYLPHPHVAPWIWAFVDEIAAAPTGKYMDQADAFSQAMSRLDRGTAPPQMQKRLYR
jgi:predicted phage terminase large subunit-like protein